MESSLKHLSHCKSTELEKSVLSKVHYLQQTATKAHKNPVLQLAIQKNGEMWTLQISWSMLIHPNKIAPL